MFAMTTAITPRDFSSSTTDPNRDRWTTGALRHVLAAVGDSPLIVVLDTSTGHTVMGVTLAGLRQAPGFGSYQVLVSYTADDDSWRTWHPLSNLGAIIPMEHSGAKWTATRTFMAEASSAVSIAQAQHGATEGREWGKWETHTGADGVTVTYAPYPSTYADVAPRGNRGHWTYGQSELVG